MALSFKLVPYKPCFHYAILSATAYDLPGKWGSILAQKKCANLFPYMINVEYCIGKSDDTLHISAYALVMLSILPE